MIKATDTHSEYVMLLFHSNACDANPPHCYVYTHVHPHCCSVRHLPFSVLKGTLFCTIESARVKFVEIYSIQYCKITLVWLVNLQIIVTNNKT
jgi:hypothetical protein